MIALGDTSPVQAVIREAESFFEVIGAQKPYEPEPTSFMKLVTLAPFQSYLGDTSFKRPCVQCTLKYGARPPSSHAKNGNLVPRTRNGNI